MDSYYITEEKYENNLLFYTILKNLLQCKAKEEKLILFQSFINENKENYINKANDLKAHLLLSNYVPNSSKEVFGLLLQTLNNSNFDMWIDLVDCAIELMIFKNLILEETNAYISLKSQTIEKNIKDKLSLKYDISKLELPYGKRVISSLLTFVLTDTERDRNFVLQTSNKIAKSIYTKINNVSANYHINCNNMMMLIVSESVNQSIKSEAGSSYEDRILSILAGRVNNLEKHVHDKNIPAVEYDYKFDYEGYTFGISAKRTLRERYKQNHEDTTLLEVDYVIAITLGVDLNEDKMNNILQKKGNYIVVAEEIYDENPYLISNNKVYSSKMDIHSIFKDIIENRTDGD